MPIRHCASAVFALAALGLAAAALAQQQPCCPTPLGKFPFCEASAARWTGCSAGSGGTACVLSADNEITDKLYLFSVQPNGELASAKELPLKYSSDGAKKIEDIEAIDVGPQGILAFGSHSRKSFKKKHCELDDNRLRFALLTRNGDTLEGTAIKMSKADWESALSSVDKCATLFAIPNNDPRGVELAHKVCAVIVDANSHATESEAACSNTFNIEGAVSLPSADGVTRYWLGLRAPLVENGAVLLRLKDLTRLQFDAVALLDLGGLGVRDLAYARQSLWILAGPSADQATGGTLWTVPVADLTSGEPLKPQRTDVDAGLPAFAEGLAIDSQSGEMVVIADGDTGDGPKCVADALQTHRHLGPLAP